MHRDESGWLNIFKQIDAFWEHSGNPKQPHIITSAGGHTGHYFNSDILVGDESLMRVAVSDLIELFTQNEGDISKVQAVVGPQSGATKLAEMISWQIWDLTGNDCISASPAKIVKGGQKSMVFSREECDLIRGRYALPCDDVLTTGESVDLTVDAIENVGGAAMPFVLVLVNRSGLTKVGGREIIALINHPMPVWEPEKCLLCPQGSEAIRPEGPAEWARLNASY